MTGNLYVGPYDYIDVDSSTRSPWYVLPFDKDGFGTARRTLAHLLHEAASGGYTDIFAFAHGWNNDWRAAVGDAPDGTPSGRGYRGFIQSYQRLRRIHALAYTRPYRPLLLGIFWPATILVLPWEEAPEIASGGNTPPPEAIDAERREVEQLAETVPAAERGRFYDLAQRDGLSPAEALELAHLLLPVYQLPDDELPATTTLSAAQVVSLWRASGERPPVLDTGDEGGPIGGTQPALPEAAGWANELHPRTILRRATVRLMKDRAGHVGALGVGPLLADLLATTTARVHLLGHSYGCRLLLSALSFPQQLPRPVESLLLLQPAVSHRCFALDADGQGRPGGYRPALQRVAQPILCTWSRDDSALRTFYQLALRRSADVGEAEIAGGDEPPGPYAALGGYGPRGCALAECASMPIKPVGERYDLGPDGHRLLALDATGIISQHNDFDVEQVWWALYSQVMAS